MHKGASHQSPRELLGGQWEGRTPVPTRQAGCTVAWRRSHRHLAGAALVRRLFCREDLSDGGPCLLSRDLVLPVLRLSVYRHPYGARALHCRAWVHL